MNYDDEDLDLENAQERLWLVKLPKFLFDKWQSSPSGAELGRLKVNEANRREMKVVLNEDDKSIDIPLEYALEMPNSNVSNTFVFSEPAPKAWPDQVKAEDESHEAYLRRAGGPNRSRKNLGGQRIAGRVVHDCLVKPIDNAHYRSLLRNRVKTADVPERRVALLHEDELMHPGSGGLKSFLRTKPKSKVREVAARMSLDALIDAISKCFQEYEYWSLKAFKAHLKQPESYLKETLESIATLHKRGPMSGKWQLKAETRNAMKGFAGLSQFNHEDDVRIKSEHVGEAAPDDDIDDSDEDIEMEDRL